MITVENIEAYLLDYQEGNLSQQEISDLFQFIEQHPEFTADFDMEIIPIDTSIQFENKDALKKDFVVKPNVFQELNENVTELLIVAKIENQLSDSEEIHFQESKKAIPTFEKEFQAYSKTIIPIDHSIFFKDKETLRKDRVIVPIFTFRRIVSYAAAASVVLFIGYTVFYSNPTSKNGQRAIIVKPTKKLNSKDSIKDLMIDNSITNQFAFNHNPIFPQISNQKDSTQNIYELPNNQNEFILANQIDSVFNELNNSETIALVSPNENSTPIIRDLPAETISVKGFFTQKVNELVYGSKNPSDEERFESISRKVSSASGLNFSFSNKKSKGFFLKIGKFSIERKKS